MNILIYKDLRKMLFPSPLKELPIFLDKDEELFAMKISSKFYI